MTAASQWLHATTGRITTDPHSWMTAVHWITGLAAKGLYAPTQAHSPKWGATTLVLAQELSALKVCRPGIAYLMRKLKASERTIQYHLTMLRETGLLVYRSKGTRARGVANQATVYERTIPAAFDEEHGIRTAGEGVRRRPVGAAPEARTLLGNLAKKAARKTRRRPRRTPVSGRGRCTPMEGGSTGTLSADRTYFPPESKLASGNGESSARKSVKRGPRKLNKIGRRYQLAAELIATIPWLHNANRARIAWIIRHVADAGWTAIEVQAAAECLPLPQHGAFRPSGLLASRLASCHLLYTTKDRRRVLVENWQDSRRAEQDRHAEYVPTEPVTGPQSPAARRAMAEAFDTIRRRLEPAAEPVVDDSPLTLDDLSEGDIVQMRLDAMADPSLIRASLELAGEAYTRRLYTNRLVDQTLTLDRLASRNTLAPAF